MAGGFGTTTTMWMVAYFSLMQPGLVVGEALFALTLLCLFAGGFVAGRHTQTGEVAWIAGLKVGLTSAMLNLLLLGSLVSGKSEIDKVLNGWSWVLGLFGGSIILAMLGAVVGSAMRHSHASRTMNWHSAFLTVAAATVGLLLVTGGLVTGLEAGLAVPDWPNSFGHNMLLYPLAKMVGGVFYEHAHRLYGMLVGVTAITVAATMFALDSRRWMRGLAVAYLLMVCVQGYMGGARVFEKSTALAIVHGVFGQIVFATIACIAAFASTTWKSGLPAMSKPSARIDRAMSMTLTIALVVQLGLGALYRHLQRAMANPPEPIHALYTHILVAVIVTALVIFVAGRAWGMYRDSPVLPALGRTLLILVGVQIMLGISAMMVVWMSKPHEPTPAYEVIITTAHQMTGALLLMTSALLTLWTRRLLAAEPRVAEVQHATA